VTDTVNRIVQQADEFLRREFFAFRKPAQDHTAKGICEKIRVKFAVYGIIDGGGDFRADDVRNGLAEKLIKGILPLNA